MFKTRPKVTTRLSSWVGTRCVGKQLGTKFEIFLRKFISYAKKKFSPFISRHDKIFIFVIILLLLFTEVRKSEINYFDWSRFGRDVLIALVQRDDNTEEVVISIFLTPEGCKFLSKNHSVRKSVLTVISLSWCNIIL